MARVAARPPTPGAIISLIQGALFTVMVLRLGGGEGDSLEAGLRTQIGRSPQFYANAPVVLDLSETPGYGEAAEFVELKRRLRTLDLIPVGVQNATAEQQRAAAAAGLGAFAGAAAQRRAPTQSARQPAAARSLLVTEPVRSGTQIYARGGDLIVLRSVSPGAEIIADGHIHVYGTLRGRAIAGAGGDGNARIFVKRLEAELLSVAGRYLVSDQIGSEHHGKQVQVLLEGDRIAIVEN